MEVQFSNPQSYNLGFLQANEKDFKNELLVYIKTQYKDLLDEEDLKLLASGDEAALGSLSQKLMGLYRSKGTSKVQLDS